MYEGVYEDTSLCRILSTDGSHVIKISKNLRIGESSILPFFDCQLLLYVKKNGPRLNLANDRQYQYYPNCLQRNFLTEAPNMVWVSDITYARVGNDFLYLCVVIDLYARKVVSYAVSEYIDEGLVTEAFERAYKSRACPKGLLFHSDQGTQYTAFEFHKKLREYDVTQSCEESSTGQNSSCCNPNDM